MSLQALRSIEIATPLEDDLFLFDQMSGSEELGRPFQYSVDLLSQNESIEVNDLLGENVTVRLDATEEEPRFFNGYVSQMAQLGRKGGLAHYRIELRPWLWFLTRAADCRIFQSMTVPDIVKQVFRDHGFTDFEEQLSGTYRNWEYCVQYRETDFNFVSRLLEQEGIYYYFKHEDGSHTLVLSDALAAHTTRDGYEEIPYIPPDESDLEDRECVSDWLFTREVMTGTYALKDFDFKLPRTDLLAKLSQPKEHSAANFEVYDYPGEYVESSEGDEYVKVRLQEIQARFERVHGSSNARGLVPGMLFSLIDHPRSDQNREYLVVSTAYALHGASYESGGDGGGPTFSCDFQTLSSDCPYRSARITPKPAVQGPQTATVVGKAGEEIWTDEFGRVKVQFPWDRYGAADENSSCWIRVSHSCAGKGWGAIQIPRIGQEVIIEFLEGDPDRPIISGRVYNGANGVPYPLPEQQTISTMKSNSSKGGGGFNEIRMEDKKDEEQIFIHAQKNFDLRVGNDRFESVIHDRHTVVDNDRFDHVKNDRHVTIDNHHQESIGGDRNLSVTGADKVEITGQKSVTVGGDVAEEVAGNHHEAVAGNYFLEGDTIVIEGMTNITLKVGGSSIAISSSGIKIATSGDVAVEGTNISNAASAEFAAEGGASAGVSAGGPLNLEGGGPATLKGAMTKVEGGITEIKGGLVKIN